MPMNCSIELFPPKDDLGEERLWNAIKELTQLKLDFISVTYGAGGSTRDRTIRIAKEIQGKTGTPTIAHLTCVGSTRDELLEILGQYKTSGIKSILALRGDPVVGPSAEWTPTIGGLNHADELVELIKNYGGFEIGVAAFPDGHPASKGNFQKDIEVLLRKESLGATFATTQFFFEASHYFKLIEALNQAKSKLKVIPGVLPITNIKQLRRMTELSGTKIPVGLEQLFTIEMSPEEVEKVGIDWATKFSTELIEGGASGLHFYTMNSAKSTIEIVRNLGLSSVV